MLVAFLFIWRIILFSIAATSPVIIPTFHFSFPYIEKLRETGLPIWITSFAHFDGIHYLSIAQSWYGEYFTQAFFPLYPLLLRLITAVLPHDTTVTTPLLVGLTISFLFLLGSLNLFDRLLSLDHPRSVRRWSLIFLLVFPTAFFFSTVYSESLFLLLTIAAFFLARKKAWWWAAIIGGLMSGTKVVGVLLLPALMLEYILIMHPQGLVRHQWKPLLVSAGKSCRFLWIVPLGLVAYILFQWRTLGHPFFFLHSQTQFGAGRLNDGLIFPPQVLWRYMKILMSVPMSQYDFWVAVWELGFTVVGFGLLLLGIRWKVRPSYLLFGFLVLILPTLSGTFQSMPRYFLTAFPIFLVLGMIRSTAVKVVLAVVFGGLQAVFFVLFTRGWWVG